MVHKVHVLIHKQTNVGAQVSKKYLRNLKLDLITLNSKLHIGKTQNSKLHFLKHKQAKLKHTKHSTREKLNLRYLDTQQQTSCPETQANLTEVNKKALRNLKHDTT